MLLGTVNKATAATQISALTSDSNSSVSLASGDVGVEGYGDSVGVTGTAVPGSNGDGVQGTADGSGTGVTGVAGAAEIGLGVGITAQHVSGGTALQVLGTAVFSRSGTLTIKAGAATATQTGVTLTAASLILATLQRNLPGGYVQSAVPDAANNSFTVHLSKAAPASATVAWFIVN